MIDQILSFLGQGISATFSWFDSLLDSTGARVILYGFITMALVFKFIILPFSGTGGVGAADSLGVNDAYYKKQRSNERAANVEHRKIRDHQARIATQARLAQRDYYNSKINKDK